jgi:stress response protein YsnF
LKREEVVIPVVEETARVTKRAVSRGTVRVAKVVTEHEEVVDTSTIADEIEIERVARDVILKKPAKPRREGDTLIVPVMQEITVVEKRLVLVEELYIRRKKVKHPSSERVRLRREQVNVDRKK